jgi:hypothetical protein
MGYKNIRFTGPGGEPLISRYAVACNGCVRDLAPNGETPYMARECLSCYDTQTHKRRNWEPAVRHHEQTNHWCTNCASPTFVDVHDGVVERVCQACGHVEQVE